MNTAPTTGTIKTETGLTITGPIVTFIGKYATVRAATEFHEDGYVDCHGIATHVGGIPIEARTGSVTTLDGNTFHFDR